MDRQIHDLVSLEKQLNELLAKLLPKKISSKRRRVAMDLVQGRAHDGR